MALIDQIKMIAKKTTGKDISGETIQEALNNFEKEVNKNPAPKQEAPKPVYNAPKEERSYGKKNRNFGYSDKKQNDQKEFGFKNRNEEETASED